jgi:HD superfamily phosphohydrolase
MLESMIENSDGEIDLDKDSRHFIENLILGHDTYKNPNNEINWIYQIVANKKNSIDVDKFDYIRRDAYHVGIKSATVDFDRIFMNSRIINNELCFNVKVKIIIYLFLIFFLL